MTGAENFMKNFMLRLNSGGFLKDNQPNKGPDINSEFIDNQVISYNKLLNSGLIELAMGQEVSDNV